MIVHHHDAQVRTRIGLLHQTLQTAADIDRFVARRNDHGDLRRALRGRRTSRFERLQKTPLIEGAGNQPSYNGKPNER